VKIWVNGRLSEEADARVSPLDHALLTGDGVFETLKIERSVAFAVRRHLERLERSAAGLDLPPPPADQVRAALADVIAANDLTDGVARITLTGGPAPLGSDRGSAGPTLIVACGPPRNWGPAAAVVVVPWPRNEQSALAGLKTVSYAENVIALRRARDDGAEEAMFGNLAGHLCEGTGTNIFVGTGGRLLTPPLTSGCLAGVTRDLLLELGVAEEADLPLSALADADEAFLTSSTRDVQAISSVDGASLPACPGPLTKAAGDAFRDLQNRDSDP